MSIFARRGRGDCGQRCSIWIFKNFLVKFPTLGTGKLFKSNNISLSAFKKTAVWGKIWGQNPQDWDKGSVQMLHLCRTPHLRKNIFVPASQGCCGRAWWRLVPNFCSWVTRKILLFWYKSNAKHPRFYRFRARGSLQFSLEHSLALHWQLKYLRDCILWWLLKYC